MTIQNNKLIFLIIYFLLHELYMEQKKKNRKITLHITVSDSLKISMYSLNKYIYIYLKNIIKIC